MKYSILKFINLNRIELGLFIFALFISSIMSILIHNNGLTTILSDQSAHLVFSRLLLDSLTPGISQLGLWPPLLHIVMSPFTAVPKLFQTGLAGFICLLPFFIASVLLFYRLSLRITNSVWLSLFATIIYSTNPFVLYYSSTPMMEILFLFFIISTAYFCVEWIIDNKLQNLLLAGVSIALGSIARFEALILLPIVGAIVLLQLVRRRFSYIKIEATVIIFYFIATVGLFMIMLYDFIYFSTPFGFLSIASPNWTVEAIGDGVKYQINPLTAFFYASYYMLGYPLVIFSLIAAILSVVFSKSRFILVSAMFILVAPAISVIISLAQGVSTVLVPELSPLNDFHNVRYALTWVGFMSLVLAVFPSTILSRYTSLLPRFFMGVYLIIILCFSGYHFYANAIDNQFSVIRRDRSVIDRSTSIAVSTYLKNNYDYGFILANRYGSDDIFIRAGIPLSTYIHEGNFRVYLETLRYPWFFARHVLLIDPETLARNGWKSEVTDEWYKSDKFLEYYELVFQSGGVNVYRLKEEVVKKTASEMQVLEKDIPSLNSNTGIWSFDNQNLTLFNN